MTQNKAWEYLQEHRNIQYPTRYSSLSGIQSMTTSQAKKQEKCEVTKKKKLGKMEHWERKINRKKNKRTSGKSGESSSGLIINVIEPQREKETRKKYLKNKDPKSKI